MSTATSAAPTAGTSSAMSLLRKRWVRALGVLVLLLIGYFALGGAFPYPEGLDLGLSPLLDRVYEWVVLNRNGSPLFLYFFNYISVGLGSAVVLINQGLTLLTWPGVAVLGGLGAWRVGGWRVSLLVLATFAVFGFTGLWAEAMTTLALIITSVALALLIGIPLGITAGRSDRFNAMIRPVLDFMQIMPAFAYLMPALLVFGIGNPAAAVVTTVYAIPPAVRITALAIRGVDQGAVEATTSLGSTPMQLLRKVQLPLAKRTILLGVNQTIMLAVSMVVIASIIGAGGLGDAIYQALSTVNVGEAFEAGLAIVMLAIAMDRVMAAAGDPRRTPGTFGGMRTTLLLSDAAIVVVVAVVASRVGLREWPKGWEVDIAAPINAANAAAQNAIGDATAALATWTLTWLLDPLRSVLTDSPWWLVIVAAALLGWIFGGRWIALTCGLSLLATGLLGVWERSMDTLSLVVVAAAVTIAIGVVIGVLISRSDTAAAIVRPILDAMQTLPPFVYLIPAVALFGVGRIPALAAAVIFALPPVIRLVNDGIRGVSESTVEAAASQGSTSWQLLSKVRLPLARSSLLLAVNQGIMMVLAMVVMGALVGAGALGYGVVFGLAQNQLGLGITSGLAIVGLGLFLDRLTQGRRTHA